MRLSDIVSHAGLAIYAQIALVIFILAFIAIVIAVFRPSRKAAFDRFRHLPLDDDQTPNGREDAAR